MKTASLLKPLIVATFLIPPPIISLFDGGFRVLTSVATAQSDAWVVGSEWVDLFGADQANDWPVNGLPVSANPLRYDGTPAQRSQVTRSDGQGNLLFFIVDGRIYDAEGYLIADHLGTGCTECVDPGIMEMLTVPVPGSCGVFFILSSTTATTTQQGNISSRVAVSVLDLNAENTYWPGRSGALINFYSGDLVNMFPAFEDWEWELILANNAPPSEYSFWLPEPEFFTDKVHSPMIRVIDPDGDGDLFWMYFILKDQVIPYRIDETGIRLVTTGTGGFVPTYYPPSPWGQKSYARDADVSMNASGQVILAMSDCNLEVYNATTGSITGSYQLLVLRFNGATGAFIDAVGHPFDGTNASLPNMACASLPVPPEPDVIIGLNGLALLENATKLLFTGERLNSTGTGWEPTIGIYDLAAQTWTDLVAQLNIADPVNFVRSRIVRNRVPGETGTAVYFPFPQGNGMTGNVAALLNAELPGSMQWIPTLAASGLSTAHQFTPLPGTGSGFNRPIFLNTQITRDEFAGNALSTFSGYCCAYIQLQNAVPGYIVTQPLEWDENGTTFGNVNEITFSEDLVITTGVQLEVRGITLRFGPNARLIVQRGAQFRGEDGAVLTAIDCEDTRWPGIRVEGTTNDASQTYPGHGSVVLNECTIEYAEIGIYGGRDPSMGQSNSYYGGKVVVRNSTFKDCVTGVNFQKYRRWIGNTVELPNLNNLSNTSFITTDTWRGPGAPKRGAHLFKVNGVTFAGCTFINQVPGDFILSQRGNGIEARKAGFFCGATAENPDSRFENLYLGVLSNSYLPENSYTLDGNVFTSNFKGVLDMGGRDPVIINNQFQTLDPALITNSAASIGLHLHQTERYGVEKNTFTGYGAIAPSTGVWFTGPTKADNRVYDNDFTDLTFGCVVEGVHLSQTLPYTVAPGLQMLCGYHEDNSIDQLILGQNGYIKYLQGIASAGFGTANNMFNSAVSCNLTGAGPYYHPMVLSLGGYYPLHVRYHVYQHPNNPELRPDCIEDGNGDPISFIADFYDLVDIPAIEEFNRLEHCDLHIHAGLAPGSASISILTDEYESKRAELISAHAQYEGAVDQMRTPDLLGMIQHQPWHSSYLLRDTLMGNYPLSDSVMKAMIYRIEPMDQWHLVQVLLQNSPLSPWVWYFLDDSEILSPYFYDLVRQNQQGTGLRQVLEEELALRLQETALIKHELLNAWASDSTLSGRTEAMAEIHLADSLGDGLRDLYLHQLEHAPSSAVDLEVELQLHGDQDLVQWGQLHGTLSGDWSNLDSAQLDVLFDLALDANSSASALAWSSLLEANAWDSLPTPEVPVLQKRLWYPSYRSNGLNLEEMIKVLPNPASDRIAIVYPQGISSGSFEVIDTYGRPVQSIVIDGNLGLVECSVSDHAPGIYLVCLVVDGRKLGCTRFAVVR